MIDLLELYAHHVRDWRTKLRADEWYFARFREAITGRLSSAEAFQLIPQAVSLTMQQTEEYLCIEAFELLMSLIVSSDTTEMPHELEAKWNGLVKHVSALGDYHRGRVDEMKKWYRKD